MDPKEAYQKIASIISALEDALIGGDAHRFRESPSLQPCWKVMRCRRKRCPAYGCPGVRCWQVAGTFCDPAKKTQGFEAKWPDCRNCPVFLAATPTIELRLQELINNVIFALRGTDPRISSIERDHALKNVIPFASHYKLTSRERSVVPLVVERLSRNEMAKLMGVAPETIKTQVKQIYRKCGVDSRDKLLFRLKSFVTDGRTEAGSARRSASTAAHRRA
jgi:DNA-binding CsgD family transcriptional regulator